MRYKYFVSYSYASKSINGFGQTCVSLDFKMDTERAIERVRQYLKNRQENKGSELVLTNFIRVKS